MAGSKAVEETIISSYIPQSIYSAQRAEAESGRDLLKGNAPLAAAEHKHKTTFPE